MKKLFTLCPKETPDCILASNRGCVYIVEKEYSDEIYAKIREQADAYEILVYSSWGYDYGYGSEESSTHESTKRIEDYQIIVSENGLDFVGVVDTSDYYSFNKEAYSDQKLHIAKVNDPVDKWKGYPLISQTGSSFSSDDHSKWDYTYYYLRKKM